MNEWMKTAWCVYAPVALQTLHRHIYDFYVTTLPKAQMNLEQMYMKLHSQINLLQNPNFSL
jgi:hypothetical protein